MAHEIWEDRFVAVRTPAWHGIGQVYEDAVLPSKAAADADLLYAVSAYPLMATTPAGPVATGLSMVGRVEMGELVNFGIAAGFDLVMLADVMPNLDELSAQYPLSAAGALRKGAEAFFTFQVALGTEIVGEEYNEYLTVVHSYTPGQAHRFIYSPVRVVCQNTLVASDMAATSRVKVAHTKGSLERLNAGYIVSDAMAKAAVIRQNLAKLSKLALTDAQVTDVVAKTYKRYKPSAQLDPTLLDLIGEDVLATLQPQNKGQENYYNNLCGLTMDTYARFNDEFPKLAATGYALYQAVVEVADHRKGRSIVGSAESALVGPKAAEKSAAYKELMAMAA
jgi:hypothetical protein